MSQAPPTRRRWFQYGLRTMLIVVTIVALILGWELRTVRERKAALKAIDEIRGKGNIVVLASRYDQWRAHPAIMAIDPTPCTVHFWRRWLGDEALVVAGIADAGEAERRRIQRLFPEAREIWMFDSTKGITPERRPQQH